MASKLFGLLERACFPVIATSTVAGSIVGASSVFSKPFDSQESYYISKGDYFRVLTFRMAQTTACTMVGGFTGLIFGATSPILIPGVIIGCTILKFKKD